MKNSIIQLLPAVLFALWSGLAGLQAATYQPASITPPKPAREFRAAWVATVANIDWPSKPGLSTADQKAELLAILDRAAQLKLNALIFQVRPACDALYPSQIEPWSEYLTGTMGKAPEPFYDPLAFVIEEAHKRAIELHAWFNPYRAHHNSAKSSISANHISKTHPQMVRQYGKFLWLDPGEKDVQDYSLSVVMDVVKRYDIDGVHFDDYFYPYKEPDSAGVDLDFPDDASWKRFGAGGRSSRDDWRRENVNAFIERVYKSIKASKPWVKFGVSPFGIWRPGNPSQIQGYDAFAKLYADSRKWLASGWIDYFAPQLYWAIEDKEHSYSALLKWWAQQNSKSRLLVPGLDSTKTRGKWKPDEIVRQIAFTRKQHAASGHIHWNMKSLMNNSSLAEVLEGGLYAQPALVPATPWLDNSRPSQPQLTLQSTNSVSRATFIWHSASADQISSWLIQTRTGGKWSTEVLPGKTTYHTFQGPNPDAVVVTAIDRSGNASPSASLELRR